MEIVPEFIPQAMRDTRSWVIWKYEVREEKKTKVLYDPKSGRRAKSIDIPPAVKELAKAEHRKYTTEEVEEGNRRASATWSDFETALDAFQSGRYRADGIGFVFGGKFCGLDIDHVLTDGKLPQELQWITDNGHTYCEISPSGTGLHLYFEGKKPSDFTACKRGDFEIYDSGRFFTVTTNLFNGSRLELAKASESAVLRRVYQTYLKPKAKEGKPGKKKTAQASKPKTKPKATMTDDAIVSKVKEDEPALWRGDLDGHSSHSEGDLVLCNVIAKYTGDAAQMDRVFRKSGLYRAKWDEYHGSSTYGELTIEKALSGKNAEKREQEPEHVKLVRKLTSERGGCFIDGMPAVCGRSGMYQVGWDAVEREVISLDGNAKRQLRTEVTSLFNLSAPRYPQASPRYVSFRNGVLDVESGEFVPHSQSLRIPNTVPHDWNPSAECEELDRALERIADGNKATLADIEEMIGLCLFRSNDFPFIFALTGKGKNGKSALMTAMRTALGGDNITAIMPDELEQRFAALNLMGKLANIGDDATSDTISRKLESVLKKVSSGGAMYSDVKQRSGVTFTPYCTMVFSFNVMPHVASNNFGFMRRLSPIPFTHEFKKTSPDFDPFVVRKLTTERASERLLVRAVTGLQRVLERGELTPNVAAEELKERFRIENDSVEAWLEDTALDAGDLDGLPTNDVYQRYKTWCENSGLTPRSAVSFGRKMSDAMPELKTVTRKDSSGRSFRRYVMREE